MEIGPIIKNPVLDINKLVRQGTMLNQSVQTVEGDSTADQATVDLLARKDPVIQEISVGMSGEELTQYTVSGTPPLSLPNSLGKPLKAWEVDVLPYQGGTGDPSPSNVRAIHGTDKINIATSGSRNFLDPSKETTYSGGLGHKWFYADGITLYAGTPYTFSVSGTNQTIALYVIDKTTGTDVAYVPSGNLKFTLSQTTLVYLQAYRGTVILPENKFQLEVGSTASPYEEFAEPTTTTITLPQTVYTGTIGSDGGESRNVKVIPRITNKQSTNQYGITNWSFNFDPPIVVDLLSMCNLLKRQTTMIAQTTDEGYFLSNAAIGYLRLDESRASTVAECNQWIADNDFYLIVTLSTPVQFPITAPTIPTPTGTATTWATAEDGTVDGMEVTYVGKA